LIEHHEIDIEQETTEHDHHRDLEDAALLTGHADVTARGDHGGSKPEYRCSKPLVRPTDFDADKGRVDPVDIATARHPRRAICAPRGRPPPVRSDPRAIRRRSVRDEARGTVDSPDVEPIYFEKWPKAELTLKKWPEGR
jgi:hypothetical protein